MVMFDADVFPLFKDYQVIGNIERVTCMVSKSGVFNHTSIQIFMHAHVSCPYLKLWRRDKQDSKSWSIVGLCFGSKTRQDLMTSMSCGENPLRSLGMSYLA